MRLRSWVVAMTVLLAANAAVADNGYPSRTGGNYSGSRWYGYYANTHNADSYVPQNFEHTNITEVWATPLLQAPYDATARANQVSVATQFILNQLSVAAQYGERAMVDVGAIVFIPDSRNPENSSCSHFCYYDNPNAATDFQTLVQTLISDGYLVPNHPELGTVCSFYVADEPDINGLADHEYGGTVLGTNGTPGGTLQLLDAIRALRNNSNTTNFPLAAIVSNAFYAEMPNNLGLFDWVGLDDYEHDEDTYIQDFAYFEDWARNHDIVHGTPQLYFLVPAVSQGLGSGGVYTDTSPIQAQFSTDNSVVGIMPYKWNPPIDKNGNPDPDGLNATSSWAPQYFALGKSIVPLTSAENTVIADFVVTH